ncbi:MAG: TIGR00341 family protein [Planctomycetota bacterium]
MALRLIEMACPEQKREEVEELVGQFDPLNLWHDRLMDEQILVKILMPAERAEAILDRLESVYGRVEGFRLILTEVQAAVPRPEPEEEEPEEETAEGGGPEPAVQRVSRHELEAEMGASSRPTRIFLALILISSVVAAIGMWRNNVAVIVGAMVIAPLLGPNMALAFAATLGDGRLGRRALRTNLTGIAAGFVVAVALGLFLPLHWRVPEALRELEGGLYLPELIIRTQVGLADIVLALGAGAAGALAFTTGIHTPLVGVMVAVALLPPLVAAGLAVGSAQWRMGLGAGLLFLTNLICINLAGVATFVLSGIHPRTWWEANRARRASRRVLVLWVLLLAALVVVILLSRG